MLLHFYRVGFKVTNVYDMIDNIGGNSQSITIMLFKLKYIILYKIYKYQYNKII